MAVDFKEVISREVSECLAKVTPENRATYLDALLLAGWYLLRDTPREHAVSGALTALHRIILAANAEVRTL